MSKCPNCEKNITFADAQDDAQCLHIMPGVIVNIPHIVCKENKGDKNPEGDGYIQRLHGEHLALHRIGALDHERSPHHENGNFA